MTDKMLQGIEQYILDPLREVAYWNKMHDKFNTTGLSLMELNETPEGKKKADKICEKIGAAMVAKFGADS